MRLASSPAAGAEAPPSPEPLTGTADISVITVTHARLQLLARKVEALAGQTLPADRFEWCVATNGDGAAAELLGGLRLPFRLRLIELPANGPVAIGRNAAVEAARGSVLLLSDDDVMPGPDCLAAHLLAHDLDPAATGDARAEPGAATGAAPRAAPGSAPGEPAAAPAARRAGRAPGRVVIGDLRLPAELRRGSVREPFERSGSLAGRALWVNATGANTSLPRSAFLAAGGYDPAFAGYGGEDSDLALRLKRRGLSFRRSARAWATHVGRILPDTAKAYLAGGAGVRVWRKNGGAGVALLLGVHPLSLAAKRLLLGTPLRRWYDPETAAYEEAYARGARDELRGAPQRQRKEQR